MVKMIPLRSGGKFVLGSSVGLAIGLILGNVNVSRAVWPLAGLNIAFPTTLGSEETRMNRLAVGDESAVRTPCEAELARRKQLELKTEKFLQAARELKDEIGASRRRLDLPPEARANWDPSSNFLIGFRATIPNRSRSDDDGKDEIDTEEDLADRPLMARKGMEPHGHRTEKELDMKLDGICRDVNGLLKKLAGDSPVPARWLEKSPEKREFSAEPWPSTPKHSIPLLPTGTGR